MMYKEILELFNVMVVDEALRTDEPFAAGIKEGFITDFAPTVDQLAALRERFKPLPLTTLFTVEERQNSDPYDLIVKQFYHYVEVYGLGMPGLFNLEVTDGKVVTLNYVKGVSADELHEMVRALLYANAPVKDAKVIKNIVTEYGVAYDINQVANNELRVLLFDENRDRFESGDDAVRFIVYKATESSLLIKSPQVIAAVTAARSKISNKFLERHVTPLSEVFNRHKRIIMALKNKSNRTVINTISRHSKVRHVPIREPISKRFVNLALTGQIFDFSVLDKMSLRDKFKFLNLLEYKKAARNTDAFIIRNGKIHIEKNRPLYTSDACAEIQVLVVNSIRNDLQHLNGKKIVLDVNVDYGLPTSRKQAIGNLPFGTTVSIEGNEISSGVYWHEDGGASDLDLSTIDVEGTRTGWGGGRGYYAEDIIFSGDLTSAPKGAMEFMTSKTKNGPAPYGLFINVYSGKPSGVEMELVIGTKTDKQWIKDPVVREKHVLDSRGCMLGFVRAGRFIVYAGRVNNSHVSGCEKQTALVARGTSGFWTVTRLLDACGIDYTFEPQVDADYNLVYNQFSYDKLEKLFNK